MKTHRYIAALLIGTAALSLSCTKEKQDPAEETAYEIVTLEACFAEPAATRVHFTGETGLTTLTGWENGDCLWVRSDTQPMWERGECFRAENISPDGHTASFTGRTRKDGRLAAIYPFGSVLDGSNNDLVKIDVPQIRTLRDGDCPAASLVAAGFLTDGGTALSMEFAVGAVKFAIRGNGEEVSSFELTDEDANQALWGTLSITPDDQAKAIAGAVMANVHPARNRVFLELETARTLGPAATVFYFVLPEGSLSRGLTLKAYGPDGSLVGSVISDKDNRISRGKVVRMPETALQSVSGGVAFEGSGIDSDPFLIKNADNLAYLARVLASETDYPNYTGKYYVQTADIDMTGKELAPLGTAARPFTGHYDGGGKSIANLATGGINEENPASGLFGYAENATITGLTLVNRSVTEAYGKTGGLAGFARNCTISGCHITGGELAATVNISGGIVAEMAGGSLTGCSASTVKISNTNNYPGGLVGYAHDGAVIRDCSLGAGTEVSGANEVGGIVGKMEGGEITNCTVSESTVSSSSEDVGAIGGWVVASCSIQQCTVSGSTIRCGSNYGGGIAGLLEKSTVSGCRVTGGTVVTGTKSGMGGIIGYMKKADASLLRNCTVDGAAEISGKANVGGMVGWLDAGTLNGCVVEGKVKVSGTADGVGGLIGRAISKSGSDNIIDRCAVRGETLITGAYSLAGLVGYAYPDQNGCLYILNSGVTETTIHGRSCDTNGDPAKGDCMDGGIIGWARLSDAGSKAWIVNCYAYLNAIQLDLQMAHPSVGGIVGYGSLSTTGVLEILNCTSTLTPGRITLAGSPVQPETPQAGTLFGSLPDRAGVRVGSNHYVADGELSVGTAGTDAVIESSNAGHPESVFKDGTTVKTALNSFVVSCTEWQLGSWTAASGGYPFPE